jgi:hypothetical protein
MTLRAITPLLFLLFLPAIAAAQDVRVKAEVDSTTFQIGEWIHTRLEVTAPKDAELQFPQGDDDIENGDFVSIDTEDMEVGNVAQLVRREMIMTVFDTGSIAVTVLVRYRLPGDTTSYVARSNTLTFTIGTVALDTSITFKDIRDVMHVSLTVWDYLLIIGIIAAVALLAWYLYKRWKRRPVAEEQALPEPEPEMPPHVEALSAIDRLEKDAPWLHGEHKGAQSRLSEILRHYIERRYRFPALEETTGEIMRDAVRCGVERELLVELEQTLRVADLAKFARFEPSIPQHEDGVHFARRFVTRTAQVEPSSSERGQGGEA